MKRLAIGRLVLAGFLIVPIGLFGAGCGDSTGSEKESNLAEQGDSSAVHQHDGHGKGESHEHGHHHAPPHGGTLVAIGDHFAHLEAVLDSGAGRLTVYVLDGEAEGSVRLEQPNLKLTVTIEDEKGGSSTFSLELGAVASPLTGETVGDSSEFSVQDERLVGVEAFSAAVTGLEIKGEKIDSLEFEFPLGNEH